MMPFKHLVDEVRGLGTTSAGIVTLVVFVNEIDKEAFFYGACAFLFLLSFAGGIYFGKAREATKQFLFWGMSTLVMAAALSAFASYDALAFLDSDTWSIFVMVVFWGIPTLGFGWLAFVRKFERKPGMINTAFIGQAGVIGALVGGMTLWVSKGNFISVLGFLLLTAFGSLLLGLAMFYLRSLIVWREG
jgi:intracellular septation protein A